VLSVAVATTDQDKLDCLATRLQRACALLLILSVLHLGSFLGIFAFLASSFVLFCAAPGAKGAARAGRRTRVFAALTAILSLVSLSKNATALIRHVPDHVAFEVKTHCDSVPKELAEGVVAWGREAWHVHEQLHRNFTIPQVDDDHPHHHAMHHLHEPREHANDEGAPASDAVSMGVPPARWFGRVLHAMGGEAPPAPDRDGPRPFSQSAFCAKTERVVRCGVRAAFMAGAALALLTLFAAVRVGCLARRLARAAGMGCAWKRCHAHRCEAPQPPASALV